MIFSAATHLKRGWIMRTVNPTERLAETVYHVCHHWEERHKAKNAESWHPKTLAPPFTIALSREAGTEASAVAQALAARLGWQVYDQELLERMAQEMGVRTRLLESVDEKRRTWLQESFEAFISVPLPNAAPALVTGGVYFKHLVETIQTLGKRGECVIVGRGAAHILPGATTLRVRLVAPLTERIAAVSNTLGLSQAEAARQVAKLDGERNAFIREHFFKNSTDPENYDLVLNRARFSLDECVGLIVEALKQRQFRSRDETQT
jgi:cytidylate kinase